MNYNLQRVLQTSFSLAKADFSTRNEKMYLGMFWYLLEPLALFLIFFLVRNLVGGDIEHYPAYLILGLIMFNLFRVSTTDAINSLQSNANLAKSINVDSKIFVLSALLRDLFIHTFEILLLIIVMAILQLPFLYLLFYPIILLFLSLFNLGLSFIVTTIAAFIPDIIKVWGFILRFWWFATPIFYSEAVKLPLNVNAINPLYYFITVGRDLIVYQTWPPLSMVFIAIIFSLLLFVVGFLCFEKYQGYFVEKL